MVSIKFWIMLGMAFLALGLTLADPDSDPAYGYRRYGRYGRYNGGYRKYSPYLSGRGYYGKPYPNPYKPGSTIPFPKVAPKIGAYPPAQAALAAQAAQAAHGAHAAHVAHNGGHAAHAAHAAHAIPSVPAHPAPAAPSVAAQVPVELSRAVPQLVQRVPQLVQQVPQQVQPQVPQQFVAQQVPQQFAPQQVPQQFAAQVPQQFAPQVPQQFAPQVPQQFAPQQVPQQFAPQVPQQAVPQVPQQDRRQRVPQRVINQLVRQAIPQLVQAVRKEIAAPVPIAAEDAAAAAAAAPFDRQLPALHIAGNGNGDIFRNNFPIQNNVLRASEKMTMPATVSEDEDEMPVSRKLRPFQPAPAGQGRFPAIVGPQDVSPVVIPQPDSEAVAILQPLAFGALGDTEAPFQPMFEFFGNDLDFNDIVGLDVNDAAMMRMIRPENLPKALPAFPAVPSLPVGI